MKLIACLTVLLSIAAKGQSTDSKTCNLPMNNCQQIPNMLHRGMYPVYQLSTCKADGGIDYRTFKLYCGNGQDDNEWYLPGSNTNWYATWTLAVSGMDGESCCQAENLHIIKPDPDNGLRDTDTLECKRKEEFIKVTNTVLTANCNGGNGDSKVEFSGSGSPMNVACDGKHKCDASMVNAKEWKKAIEGLCDEPQLDIEYRCYYDFDNKDNPTLTPSNGMTIYKR
mmetsp:Transcript_53329/g.47956  ORF Transcript_53329/g.47956 Transcript_53329/m.47956 type:complete len:225 (+) Transcript_53329:64-738(+)